MFIFGGISGERFYLTILLIVYFLNLPYLKCLLELLILARDEQFCLCVLDKNFKFAFKTVTELFFSHILIEGIKSLKHLAASWESEGFISFSLTAQNYPHNFKL